MTRRNLFLPFCIVLLALALAFPLSAAEDEPSKNEPPTPAELRTKADKFEKHAATVLLHGDEWELPSSPPINRKWIEETARTMKRWARSFREEAELREQQQQLLKEAEEREKAGRSAEAKRLRREAEEKRIQAEAVAADRVATDRRETAHAEFRDELRWELEKAAALRRAGLVAEAEQIEADVKRRLRELGLDPALSRAHELKRRALEARFEERYADAELYEREADRLIQSATHPTAHPTTNATTDAAAHAERDEARRLREDVDRLAEQVRRLTETVERLQAAGRAD